MFVYFSHEGAFTFTADDQIGLPVTGETTEGVLWFNPRTGHGLFEVAAIEADEDD